MFLISTITLCNFICLFFVFFFFKQKTAYEMRISDWSSDVCSSDLVMVMVMISGRATDAACRCYPLSPAELACAHISAVHSGRHPGQASGRESEPGSRGKCLSGCPGPSAHGRGWREQLVARLVRSMRKSGEHVSPSGERGTPV